MTPQEQIQFVHDLSENVADDIKTQIRTGKIPANWDGHELRALLAYRHTLSADMGLCGSKKARADRRRRREFLNTVAVNNL